MSKLIILKKHSYPFLNSLTTTWLEAVKVIPPVLVKGIFYQGGAENEINLTFGQAGAQLVNHFLGNDITLGDIKAVNPGKGERGNTAAAT